jgi:hypothetical protein
MRCRITEERFGISADAALRLAKFFGTTAEFWPNLQSRCDLETPAKSLEGMLYRSGRQQVPGPGPSDRSKGLIDSRSAIIGKESNQTQVEMSASKATVRLVGAVMFLSVGVVVHPRDVRSQAAPSSTPATVETRA